MGTTNRNAAVVILRDGPQSFAARGTSEAVAHGPIYAFCGFNRPANKFADRT